VRYVAAVETDARSRGVNPERIQMRAQWPLEVFDSALRVARSPTANEGIVDLVDTTMYYLVPVAGSSTDTALVQEFRFRLGSRVNSVVVEYRGNGSPFVDGSDAVPDRRYQEPRAAALEWFTNHDVE
jgi:hypothetical protein